MQCNPMGEMIVTLWNVLIALVSPIKVFFCFLISLAVSYWWAAPVGLHNLAIAALVVFVLDTLSGLIVAVKFKEYSSRRFGCAILKLAVFAIAILLCVQLGIVFSMGYTIVMMCLMLIFIRESTSVIENLDRLGFKLPDWITTRLKTAEKDIQNQQVTKTESQCIIENNVEKCESVAITTMESIAK